MGYRQAPARPSLEVGGQRASGRVVHYQPSICRIIQNPPEFDDERMPHSQQRSPFVAGLAPRDRLDGVGPAILFRRGEEDFAERSLPDTSLYVKVVPRRVGRVFIRRVEAAVGRDRRGQLLRRLAPDRARRGGGGDGGGP